MSTNSNLSKIRSLIILSIGFLLLGCEANISPEYGMIDWYLSNGTGTRMTLIVYDKVCSRTHFRVRVSTTVETPIATCANSAGRAEIRYRRTGGFTGAANPWLDSVMNSNQTLLVR